MGVPVTGQMAAAAVVAVVSRNEPSIPAVIFTGLTLVFGILIILYVVLLIQGKIFKQLDKNKQEAQAEKAAQMPKADVPKQETCDTVKTEKTRGSDGISPEVVAAITAAVAEFDGGQYCVQSVSYASNGANEPKPTKAERRGRWGLAGVMSDTEPF